jgi:WS/DGAT/MGAT family acyltransferase
MAQQHFDRLTAIDASFLHQEGPTSHMHVGALSRLEGPPPPFGELLDTLRGRLHLVPRYRQKLSVPPAGTGRPLWVDDPSFSIEYHVRQTALPSPGSEEQLLLLAGRIFSQQLDRSKPLWEMWMVEGLDDGGWALITKTHHALIDGIAGVDLAQVIFDVSPVPAEVPHPDEAWRPHSEPGAAELLAAGTLGLARTGIRVAAEAASLALRRGTRCARHAGRGGLGEIAWAGTTRRRRPLNVEIGPHRRFIGVRNRLDDFKLVRTRSAARSATSCWPSSAARCANGCTRAACAGSSARARAGLDPRSERRDTLGNHRGHARAAASTSSQSSGCAACASRWTG